MGRLALWARFGIRAKLTILILASMLVLGVATSLVATARQRATLEDQLRRRGIAIAAGTAGFAVRPLLADDLAALRRLVNHTMSEDYVRYVCLLDEDGVVVMHSDLAEIGARKTDALSRKALGSPVPGYGASSAASRSERLFGIFAPVSAAGARLGTVVLGYSFGAAEAEIGRAARQIQVVGLLAALVAGGLAYLLSSYISVPIARIAGAMRSASDADVARLVPVRRTDEIGILVASFNAMAEDLSRHRRHFEELVAARTSQLRRANESLEREIAERGRAEEELRASRQELRALASHLQSVREQERTDIAREIHDELGQALTALKMDAHWLSRRLGAEPELADKTRAMSKTIDTTVHAVRRISSELRPKLLDDLGVSAAIEWQAREFEERSGIECDIRSEPDDLVLDAARSTVLFRVFQETLTNIARHAGASRVTAVLHHVPGRVEMLVSDDGKGITPEDASDPRSLGILGMRERVYSLGGVFDIIGEAGHGTTVRVSIPWDGGRPE